MQHAVCACESLQGVGQWNVAGSLLAHDGVQGVGSLDVRDDAVTFGSFGTTGAVKIGRNLAVKGDLQQVGRLEVGGQAKVGGQTFSIGSARLQPTAFDLTDRLPCDCAGLDVATQVAEAKNDALVRRLSDVQSVGNHRAVLTTGSYFLPSFESVGNATISIQGAVALYVEGDVQLVGKGMLDVPAGSTLDLYIAGGLQMVGALFTTPPQPGAVRLYVAGQYQAVGRQDLTMSLYAPKADVQFVGDTAIAGSILARSIAAVGQLDVAYATPVTPAPSTCTEEGSGGGSAGMGGGTSGTGAGGGSAGGGTGGSGGGGDEIQ